MYYSLAQDFPHYNLYFLPEGIWEEHTEFVQDLGLEPWSPVKQQKLVQNLPDLSKKLTETQWLTLLHARKKSQKQKQSSLNIILNSSILCKLLLH